MFGRIGSGVVAALLVSSLTTSAFAQATRTWISGVGDDVNPCSRTAPCKTFAGAISKTAAGGIINALDPVAAGTVTITKAITLEGTGMPTNILNSSTNGIVVNAADTDVVIVRGIMIQGGGTGLNGIRFLKGKSLTVEACTIQNQNGPAIDVAPSGAAGTLFVRNSTFVANKTGINLTGASIATIASSRFFDDVLGLHTVATAKATIWDSIFSNNSEKGLWAEGTSEINMDRGLIADNVVGVQGDAPIRLSDVMLGHNTTGIAGTKVVSFGNNRIAAGNGADGAPSGTLPQQ